MQNGRYFVITCPSRRPWQGLESWVAKSTEIHKNLAKNVLAKTFKQKKLLANSVLAKRKLANSVLAKKSLANCDLAKKILAKNVTGK